MEPALGSQRSVLKSHSSAPSYRHSVIGKQSREEFDTAHSSHPRPTKGLLIGRNQDKQDSFVVAPGGVTGGGALPSHRDLWALELYAGPEN